MSDRRVTSLHLFDRESAAPAPASPAGLGRVWLIGENNPYGADPYYVLYPDPQGCTGERLCKALGFDPGNPDAYLETFERRNLLKTTKWSVPKAREAATTILGELARGDALVLLGARVTVAFGLKFEPLTTQTTATGHVALISAHPSGLSRVWNQAGYRPKIREAVMALVRGCGGSKATPTPT